MKNISIRQAMKDFLDSDFRKFNIPMQMVAGWPSLVNYGKTLCLVIPFFSRKRVENKVEIYPIYCSVTVPIKNPTRIFDYTIYTNKANWAKIDYATPCGYFKHEALKDVKTKQEYEALKDEFYAYYDEMVAAIYDKKAFENQEKLCKIFSMLMEPCLYPQYKMINNKFYSSLCEI